MRADSWAMTPFGGVPKKKSHSGQFSSTTKHDLSHNSARLRGVLQHIPANTGIYYKMGLDRQAYEMDDWNPGLKN